MSFKYMIAGANVYGYDDTYGQKSKKSKKGNK